MSKTRKLCSLWGHRRDKGRVRPIGDAWLSNCTRCGVSLERTISGKSWTPIAEGQMHMALHPEPQSAVNPFTRPPPNSAENDQDRQPEQQLRFARNVVNAIAPPSRAVHDSREHYIVRAEGARLLAEQAEEPQIKVMHLEIATRYYSLANYYLERPARMSVVS